MNLVMYVYLNLSCGFVELMCGLQGVYIFFWFFKYADNVIWFCEACAWNLLIIICTLHLSNCHVFIDKFIGDIYDFLIWQHVYFFPYLALHVLAGWYIAGYKRHFTYHLTPLVPQMDDSAI